MRYRVKTSALGYKEKIPIGYAKLYVELPGLTVSDAQRISIGALTAIREIMHVDVIAEELRAKNSCDGKYSSVLLELEIPVPEPK